MDIMKATPVKIIALIAALLAAVWVGVMIADGPTTKTAEVSQEQVDEFRDGQWGETSPMEQQTTAQISEGTLLESKNYLRALNEDWLFNLDEMQKAEVCLSYRDFPAEVIVDLAQDAQERGGWVHPVDLDGWLSFTCGDY